MAFIIESMRERDVEPAARLRLAAFFKGANRTLEQDMAGLRSLLAAGDDCEAALVARVGEKLAGCALLVRNELDAAHDLTPWLAGLVVSREFRRRGIGAALVNAAEMRAAGAGIRTLYLYTWDAREFYASLGWRPVEAFEEAGGPVMLMSRSLQL